VLFREVELPGNISGRLYIHSMPGRREPLEDVWAEITREGISTLVCLTPLDEIHEKSPHYADALERAAIPCILRLFPIRDYQAPEHDEDFLNAVALTANSLCSGERVLLHCGAGIGRTGMFAIATLMAVGLSEREARQRINAAGSWPERPAQEEALRRVGSCLTKGLSSNES
jgi:protein-tyrosine phosphatase